VRSRTHLRDRSACAYIISSPGERREGTREQLTVTPVPRTSSGPMRRMRQLKRRVRAVSLMQQLQRLTTERVLLADLQVELRSLLSLLGNWQSDQFVYNTHPNFERSNYGENYAYYNGISTVLYNE